MTVLLFFSLIHVGTALQYAAVPASARGLRRGPRVVAWLLGSVLTASAFLLWRQHEPGPAALFMVVASLACGGMLFALLTPVLPRLMWVLAGAAVLAVPVLIALGAWP